MWVLIAAVIILGIVVYLLSKTKQNKNNDREDPVEERSCDGQAYCCGAHDVCESGKTKKPKYDYYEDEELDRFRGKASDEYTSEEVEEFNEILRTLRPEEIKDWLKSLATREINLPCLIKDRSHSLNTTLNS